MVQHRKREQETGSLACSPSGGASWLLKWGEGGADRWAEPEEGLRWSAHPLVVPCAGIMRCTLLSLPVPQQWQLGFWIFLHLVVHNLPQLCM